MAYKATRQYFFVSTSELKMVGIMPPLQPPQRAPHARAGAHAAALHALRAQPVGRLHFAQPAHPGGPNGLLDGPRAEVVTLVGVTLVSTPPACTVRRDLAHRSSRLAGRHHEPGDGGVVFFAQHGFLDLDGGKTGRLAHRFHMAALVRIAACRLQNHVGTLFGRSFEREDHHAARR